MTVRAIRSALGLTQAEIAAVLGVHSLTVSKWERGILTPTPHQEALRAAFARSQRLAPRIGARAAIALRDAGIAAALYELLKPGYASSGSTP